MCERIAFLNYCSHKWNNAEFKSFYLWNILKKSVSVSISILIVRQQWKSHVDLPGLNLVQSILAFCQHWKSSSNLSLATFSSSLLDIKICHNQWKLVSANQGKYFIESKKEGKCQKSIQSIPHLTQDTNGKVTNSLLDITNENQEVSTRHQ